jgi:hypothetical protein
MRSSIQHILVLLITTTLLFGCAKDLLDKKLDYNPFDPEYTGASPFEFVSAVSFVDVVLGQPVPKIRVRFSVNESLFTSQQPFYSVQMSSDENGANLESKTSNTAVNGIFEYVYEHPPQSDCIYLALENASSTGKTFELCFEI